MQKVFILCKTNINVLKSPIQKLFLFEYIGALLTLWPLWPIHINSCVHTYVWRSGYRCIINGKKKIFKRNIFINKKKYAHFSPTDFNNMCYMNWIHFQRFLYPRKEQENEKMCLWSIIEYLSTHRLNISSENHFRHKFITRTIYLFSPNK